MNPSRISHEYMIDKNLPQLYHAFMTYAFLLRIRHKVSVIYCQFFCSVLKFTVRGEKSDNTIHIFC